MLPGFRILFATIVLAVSVLIFGLGAAALLRASHEEFANLPSWRLAQQPQFAPKAEPAPTLAMLRIDAPTPKTFVQELLPPLPKWPVAQPVFAQPVLTQPVVAFAVESAKTLKDPEPAAQLNAQVSTDEPPAPDEPAVAPEPADATASEPGVTTPPLVAAMPPETRAPEIRSSESSVTEASEPQTTQSVTPQVRSTEATAAETLPKPVVKRAKRASAQAIARRRQAIARARAATAAQQQQRQQQQQFPLFGG